MSVISTIRPGVLVSLKTSMQGNVRYDREDLGEFVEGSVAEKDWKTKRTIADIEEFEVGGKVRAKALSLIRGKCARSAFGLLCPESKVEELDAAITEANRLVDEFNRRAKVTQVHVYTIAGRIQPDDERAIKAIKSEIRQLVDIMSEGVRKLDPKAIRKAANQARSVGQMLPDDARERVQEAIKVARKAATDIGKAGEIASTEINKTVLKQLAASRTAFLDFEDEKPASEAPKPKVERFKPTQRQLDL